MKLVVVSPPDERADEQEVVAALVAAGLAHYHLRKPTWPAPRMASWLSSLPPHVRRRIVLHAHHVLAHELGAGGIHFRDDGQAPASPREQTGSIGLTSRSCHDLAALSASLGHYDAIFVGPVFASLSKPGYGPMSPQLRNTLRALLAERTIQQRVTAVLALGGVTRDRLADCRALGFDGAAVLGAVWEAPNPVAAFVELGQVSSALATTNGIRPGGVKCANEPSPADLACGRASSIERSSSS